MAQNVRSEEVISAEAHGESYHYHAVLEALANGSVNCSPPNMANNSQIVYRIIATI